MRLFYRISDKGLPKPKLPGVDKEVCLSNFCKVFATEINNLVIVADRCSESTLTMLSQTNLEVVCTDLGNSGSLRMVIEEACRYSSEEVVYFCEDDYLHLPESPELIREISSGYEYFTLYDHPDKYTNLYGHGEQCKVIRTKSRHWRTTKSTCMTFGCRVQSIQRDQSIWMKYLQEEIPQDHGVFSELYNRGIELAVAIPGAACHTDLTFSGRANHVLMESWAIDMMIDVLKAELSENEQSIAKTMARSQSGWPLLVGMHAVLTNKRR